MAGFEEEADQSSAVGWRQGGGAVRGGEGGGVGAVRGSDRRGGRGSGRDSRTNEQLHDNG